MNHDRVNEQLHTFFRKGAARLTPVFATLTGLTKFRRMNACSINIRREERTQLQAVSNKLRR